MFVMFAAGAVLWAVTLARSRAHTHRLHILMGVLAAFKALTLLSQAGELHLVKTTGHTGNWNIAVYIFTFLRGILFFTARASRPAPPAKNQPVFFSSISAVQRAPLDMASTVSQPIATVPTAAAHLAFFLTTTCRGGGDSTMLSG
jgi:hypothetical protein